MRHASGWLGHVSKGRRKQGRTALKQDENLRRFERWQARLGWRKRENKGATA